MIELLKKYDRPVPRYTSYPTAPEWNSDFAREDYLQVLNRASREPEAPLSLYVHIPFCARRCLFCGCTTMVPSGGDTVQRYLGDLDRELATVREALGSRNRIMQLHWGGGTPTYFQAGQLEQLFTAITEKFRLIDNAEVAIEVDPRVTTAVQVRQLRDLGFNRISMGVQDFSEEVQAAIGRRQTASQSIKLYELCRNAGFGGINMDLVYGLPRQTRESFSSTLDQLTKLRPDRVAIYSFAYLPSIKSHQRKLKADELPALEEKYGLFALAVERLLAAGYVQIGMDHFALPDDELATAQAGQKLHRNFMGYTTKPASDMIGIGMSAIGDLGGCYVQNEAKIDSYHQAISDHGLATYRGCRLSEDDLIRRRLITYLMCNLVLPHDLIEREFAINFQDYFATELGRLSDFISDGLLTSEQNQLEITTSGRTFVRNIASVFDSYLARKSADKSPTYSRSV